jgi:hypothetical protein
LIAEAGFLFAVTAVNMSLASLAGLVVAFRRGGAWAAYDLYRLRQIVEFGFANALFALALVPLSASVGSVESAVRVVALAAFVYFVVDVLVLVRRWRGVSGEFPLLVIALDLALIFGLVTAVVLGTVAAWEWVLLALTARPMAAFLLVLSTLRSDER